MRSNKIVRALIGLTGRSNSLSLALWFDDKPTNRLLRRIEKIFGPISQFDLRVVSTRLSTPAVLVHDRGDDEVPFALLQQVAQKWPQSQLIETIGYGHSGHLRAEAFCEAAAAFISGKTKTLEFPLSGNETGPRLRSVREKVKTLAEAVVHSTAP